MGSECEQGTTCWARLNGRATLGHHDNVANDEEAGVAVVSEAPVLQELQP